MHHGDSQIIRQPAVRPRTALRSCSQTKARHCMPRPNGGPCSAMRLLSSAKRIGTLPEPVYRPPLYTNSSRCPRARRPGNRKTIPGLRSGENLPTAAEPPKVSSNAVPNNQGRNCLERAYTAHWSYEAPVRRRCIIWTTDCVSNSIWLPWAEIPTRSGQATWLMRSSCKTRRGQYNPLSAAESQVPSAYVRRMLR